MSLEGRLLISDRAHLLFDLHKEIDGAREAELAGTGKQVGNQDSPTRSIYVLGSGRLCQCSGDGPMQPWRSVSPLA